MLSRFGRRQTRYRVAGVSTPAVLAAAASARSSVASGSLMLSASGTPDHPAACGHPRPALGRERGDAGRLGVSRPPAALGIS